MRVDDGNNDKNNDNNKNNDNDNDNIYDLKSIKNINKTKIDVLRTIVVTNNLLDNETAQKTKKSDLIKLIQNIN